MKILFFISRWNAPSHAVVRGSIPLRSRRSRKSSDSSRNLLHQENWTGKHNTKTLNFESTAGIWRYENECMTLRQAIRLYLRRNIEAQMYKYIDGSCSVDCINCSLVSPVSRQMQSDGFILFIYLLGVNQKEHTWQMVWKEMRDQCIVERVYVLHKI